MSTGRFKDVDWKLPEDPQGGIVPWDAVIAAILMDIRDELKQLNGTFDCPNFLAVPRVLRQIVANTAKPKRKKAKP